MTTPSQPKTVFMTKYAATLGIIECLVKREWPEGSIEVNDDPPLRQSCILLRGEYAETEEEAISVEKELVNKKISKLARKIIKLSERPISITRLTSKAQR